MSTGLVFIFFEKINNQEFNFMTKESYSFLNILSKNMKYHSQQGLWSNQIFLLMFNKLVNQSITSALGVDFGNRVLSVLHNVGR